MMGKPLGFVFEYYDSFCHTNYYIILPFNISKNDEKIVQTFFPFRVTKQQHNAEEIVAFIIK